MYPNLYSVSQFTFVAFVVFAGARLSARSRKSKATPPTQQMVDPTKLAYAGEIPLESSLPGRYVVQVTVIDRVANTAALQPAALEIE